MLPNLLCQWHWCAVRYRETNKQMLSLSCDLKNLELIIPAFSAPGKNSLSCTHPIIVYLPYFWGWSNICMNLFTFHLFSATTWKSNILLDIQSGEEAYHGSAESHGDQCGFMETDEESGLQRGGLTRIDDSIWSESIKSYLLKVQMVKGRWILKVLEFCSMSSVVTAVRYRYMTILVFYTGRTSAVNAEIVLGLFIWYVKENEWQVISAVV